MNEGSKMNLLKDILKFILGIMLIIIILISIMLGYILQRTVYGVICYIVYAISTLVFMKLFIVRAKSFERKEK